MQMRKLGRSSLEIAPLVLGGNVFGWTADEATSFAILDAFVGAAASTPSTPPTSIRAGCPATRAASRETVIGAWLKARGGRDKVIIATKFGAPMADDKKGLSQGLHDAGGRGVAEAAAEPTTSTSTSPISTIRRRRRTRSRRPSRGWWSRARCARSAPPTSPPSG